MLGHWSKKVATNTEKRMRLQAAGFKVGADKEFLELTPEENALIEMRLALRDAQSPEKFRRLLSGGELRKVQ